MADHGGYLGSHPGDSVIVPMCAAALVLIPNGHATPRLRPRLVADDTIPFTVARAAAIHAMGLESFEESLAEFVIDGGLLTDELREPLNGVPGPHQLEEDHMASNHAPGRWPWSSQYPWRRLSWLDLRQLPERWNAQDTLTETRLGDTQEFFLDRVYLELQGARAVVSVAARHLDRAPPAGLSPTVLRGYRSELYALAGYTEIFLADLFCSGIPLSTFPALRSAPDARAMYLQALSNPQTVYQAGAPTTQVYQDAIAKLDTAMALAGDSARLLNLARVGRGRAWLALGRYDSAATAVAAVPQDFSYALRSFWNLDPDGDEVLATVADREGGNGLPYLTSQDPRTATHPIASDKGMGDFLFPARLWPDSDRAKYQTDWYAQILDPLSGNGNLKYEASQLDFPFTIASGEEAALIRAEAALQQLPGDTTWLHLLNHLRAAAPIPGTSHSDPARLPPLHDPGSTRARLALLFAERAQWLFLTGHRQGDLRRLVRNYHWPQEQVYPTGPYVVPSNVLPAVGQYGTDVNLPIPPEELVNPQFLGCQDRRA